VNHLRELEIERVSSNIRIQQLESEKKLLKTRVDQLEGDQDSSEKNMLHLTARVNMLNHTEVGEITCARSQNWQYGDSGHQYYEQRINFQQSYSRTPTVHIEGIPYADIHESDDQNARYHVYVTSVDEHGFKVRCETWFSTNIYRMMAAWISIPQ
jgi:hypothetical protein